MWLRMRTKRVAEHHVSDESSGVPYEMGWAGMAQRYRLSGESRGTSYERGEPGNVGCE